MVRQADAATPFADAGRPRSGIEPLFEIDFGIGLADEEAVEAGADEAGIVVVGRPQA